MSHVDAWHKDLTSESIKPIMLWEIGAFATTFLIMEELITDFNYLIQQFNH